MDISMDVNNSDDINFMNKFTKLYLSQSVFDYNIVLGSLLKLEDKNVLSNINQIKVISMNSIIALLYILGYSIHEIISSGLAKDIFEDSNDFVLHDMMRKMGYKTIDSLEKKIRNACSEKTGTSNWTLADLKSVFGISLTVYAYNLSKQEIESFSSESHPNMNSITIILMASALPFYHHKYEYKNNIYFDCSVYDAFPFGNSLMEEEEDSIISVKTNNNINVDCDNMYNYITSFAMSLLKEHGKKKTKNCIELENSFDINDLKDVHVKATSIIDGYFQTTKYLFEKNQDTYLINDYKQALECIQFVCTNIFSLEKEVCDHFTNLFETMFNTQ